MPFAETADDGDVPTVFAAPPKDTASLAAVEGRITWPESGAMSGRI